ncbi:MAG TPA: AIR synthase related protein, partial [Candidatus Atribacteria bacterium]|nr:AIR synthase related protein [Candidatus Atribacteria bacterium]
EIMMSESQERMLLCVRRGYEEEIIQIFRKWGLEGEVIGEVKDTGRVTIKWRGEVVADIPALELTRPPVYTPPRERPLYLDEVNNFSLEDVSPPLNYEEVLLRMVSSENLSSRRPIFEQYDHMAGINTVLLPGSGTVVLRVKGKKWGIAVTSDCNPLYCYLSPREGAKMAVAEAARNLSACGARPAGVTDCLNFGSPEKPDRYWQFVEAVEGLSEACRFFGIPVVSGNVSFYNENPEGAIFPTPTIGMVGIIEEVEKVVSAGFGEDDLILVLLGETKEELGGSEYLRIIHNREEGPPPRVDLEGEKNLQELLITLAEEEIVSSAIDLSEGGLALALVESSVTEENPRGVIVDLECLGDMREDVLLFGESGGRALVSVKGELLNSLQRLAQEQNVPCQVIGKTGGEKLVIKKGGKSLISLSVEELKNRWEGGLGE